MPTEPKSLGEKLADACATSAKHSMTYREDPEFFERAALVFAASLSHDETASAVMADQSTRVAELEATLRRVRKAITNENGLNKLSILDTGWIDTIATAVDEIDALEKERADDLALTGCRDAEDLRNMARVGRSLMDSLDAMHRGGGKYADWVPADDPAEIVFDLLNGLDETTERLAAAEKRLVEERVEAAAALRCAIANLEHMAAWIGAQNAGYSFESLGEDIPGIKAALTKLQAAQVGNASGGGEGSPPTPDAGKRGA